jgi:signal transduction histidine kinase
MKYTNLEILDAVEREGLEYTLRHYISPKKISDGVLAALWEEAQNILTQIEEYLQDNSAELIDFNEDEDEDVEF